MKRSAAEPYWEPFMHAAPLPECGEHQGVAIKSTPGWTQGSVQPEIAVGLLTGGTDPHYAFGLAMALISKGVSLDVIGSDLIDSPEMRGTAKLNFLNLQGSLGKASFATKLSRVLIFYSRLIRYAATAEPKIFHILWNNKLEFFDRTLLMLYYKLLGKKVVFTAHNVNAGRRDSNDSLINRLTLKIQYRLTDHIFVHTEKMKVELLEEFGVRKGVVTVIPYGINNAVPDTGLSSVEAKQRLGIRDGERTILFFGAIKQYKGLEYLVAAFQQIMTRQGKYRLVIAGEPKKGHEKYLNEIQKTISRDPTRGQVIQKMEFIPDSETELYFKAADVAVLPYTQIFQSGILFLAYSFGLPVIVSDVGSFGEEIIEGRTGFLCKPCDADDLARVIEKYFDSDLFAALDGRRQEIRDYANARHSWEVVGEMSRNVYADLLARAR
jgi:D-inositol-3-phosphate glycosyltransferase